MSQFLDVAAGRAHAGVRLVLTAGAPGPWGESAKGMLHVKKIPFVRVRQDAGEENAELVAWTGIRNAPQIVDEDDRAVHAWLDLIHFAESHPSASASAPRLIPEDLEERVRMFGWLHELAGEQGLGWLRRLTIFAPVMGILKQGPNPALAGVARMAEAYGYSDEAAAAAPARIASILDGLARMLARQQDAGRRFLIGDHLTALDIHWAAFAAMLAPLPPEKCPMPDYLRQSYATSDERTLAALTPALLAHRDFVYDEFLELPVAI